MKKIGFLGCGKIGQTMVRYLLEGERAEVAFVQDPFYQDDGNFPVINDAEESLYEQADLVVECATADVLKANAPALLRHCDLMVFSVTAFSDAGFTRDVQALCAQYGHHIYIPHGAILGLDGIYDARGILTAVRIETVKNPQSLGRTDTERTMVYEGTAREACKLYPRNVNVHATIALAGLGFDATKSCIISDPAVSTNTHTIYVEGEGISFALQIRSFTTGGVTGVYTPLSACGSLERVLANDRAIAFV